MAAIYLKDIESLLQGDLEWGLYLNESQREELLRLFIDADLNPISCSAPEIDEFEASFVFESEGYQNFLTNTCLDDDQRERLTTGLQKLFLSIDDITAPLKKVEPNLPAIIESSNVLDDNDTIPPTYKINFRNSNSESLNYSFVSTLMFNSASWEDNKFMRSVSAENLRGQKIQQQQPKRSDYAAKNKVTPKNGRAYLPVPMTTNPNDYEIIAVEGEGGLSFDLFRTIQGDYYIETNKSVTITWWVTPSKQRSIEKGFKSSVNVDWSQLILGDKPFSETMSGLNPRSTQNQVLEFCQSFKSHGIYSRRDDVSGSAIEDQMQSLIDESSCDGSNWVGAVALDSIGIPVKIISGFSSSGGPHATTIAFVEGEWIKIDFTRSNSIEQEAPIILPQVPTENPYADRRQSYREKYDTFRELALQVEKTSLRYEYNDLLIAFRAMIDNTRPAEELDEVVHDLADIVREATSESTAEETRKRRTKITISNVGYYGSWTVMIACTFINPALAASELSAGGSLLIVGGILMTGDALRRGAKESTEQIVVDQEIVAEEILTEIGIGAVEGAATAASMGLSRTIFAGKSAATIKMAIVGGATEGGAEGAIIGAGSALMEGKDFSDVLLGGTIGGGAGAVIGGTTSGTLSWVAPKIIRGGTKKSFEMRYYDDNTITCPKKLLPLNRKLKKLFRDLGRGKKISDKRLIKILREALKDSEPRKLFYQYLFGTSHHEVRPSFQRILPQIERAIHSLSKLEQGDYRMIGFLQLHSCLVYNAVHHDWVDSIGRRALSNRDWTTLEEARTLHMQMMPVF